MPSSTSDRLGPIADQFDEAIIAAIAVPPISERDTLLPDILYSLTQWKSRPDFLSEMAYEWCSVICEKCPDLGAAGGWGRTCLFLSLEIGFRHLDFKNRDVGFDRNYTKHYRKIIDTVFKDGSDEVIADLLHIWNSRRHFYHGPYKPVHVYAGYLIDLRRLRPLSPRLRHLLILAISLLDYQTFEQVGSEKLFELLDHLRVRVEDTELRDEWGEFVLSIIRSPEGIRRLTFPYWEILVERSIQAPKGLGFEVYDQRSHVMEYLEDAEEWDKLECWIGFLWILWGSAANLEPATLSLFHRRPRAIQKLEGWVERRWGERHRSFRSLCERWRLSVAGQRTP